MSNSLSCKWDLVMVAALVCVAVVLGINPADRTVWCVEMVWAVGLWAILLLTRRKYRFSPPAYLCFFVLTAVRLARRSSARRATYGTRRRTSSATLSAQSALLSSSSGALDEMALDPVVI